MAYAKLAYDTISDTSIKMNKAIKKRTGMTWQNRPIPYTG